MGMITDFFGLMFGSNRNVLAETAQVFRENSENAGVRAAEVHAASLGQFAAEFRNPRRGLFDRLIDGMNRLPRPMMALGTLGLIGAAMVEPVWFASRMQGLALVPEPLWWLMGAIVSFYFGARYQVKGQDFQRSIADTLARTGTVVDNLAALDGVSKSTAKPSTMPDPTPPEALRLVAKAKPAAAVARDFRTQNAALLEWQAQNGH